jgi:mono/diheme cytochrome c family protein
MPKFALSGPEIDSIVAYINSLSAANAESPKARREARVAEAVDIGDPAKGLAYAQRVCSGCHNVLRRDRASPNRRAPPFTKVASTPGMTATALTVWSRTIHPTMPNLVIEPTDMDNLIVYILSLRDSR